MRLTLFTFFLPLAVLAFASASVHRDTNAHRLARGLAPSCPKRLDHPTNAGARRSAPSGTAEMTGGFATLYFQNGNHQGACGEFHKDSDLIAAIAHARYGYDGQMSALCGKYAVITNTNNGKSVTVKIVDSCPTCANENSLDLSQGAFDVIATEPDGIVPISWYFL